MLYYYISGVNALNISNIAIVSMGIIFYNLYNLLPTNLRGIDSLSVIDTFLLLSILVFTISIQVMTDYILHIVEFIDNYIPQLEYKKEVYIVYRFIIVSSFLITVLRFTYTYLGYCRKEYMVSCKEYVKHLVTVGNLDSNNRNSLYSFIKVVSKFILTSVSWNLYTFTKNMDYHWFIVTYIGVWLIYSFLSLIVDINCLITSLQGITPIIGFDNPMLTCGPIEFWRKWNILIQSLLKQCVYIPLRDARVNRYIVVCITFVASSLFHELQYKFSFKEYKLGYASRFFILQGIACCAERLILYRLPYIIKLILSNAWLVFTGQILIDIWDNNGMFKAIGYFVYNYSMVF